MCPHDNGKAPLQLVDFRTRMLFSLQSFLFLIGVMLVFFQNNPAKIAYCVWVSVKANQLLCCEQCT